MEAAFGAGLGGVRVHADAEADRLSRGLSARAFTVGDDIFLSSTDRDTNSAAGRHVLAHELAHTLQQSPVIHRLRTHDYDDRKVQELHNNPVYTLAVGAAQAQLPGAPIDVALANGATKVSLNAVPTIRQTVRNALQTAGIPANQLGQVMGQVYALSVGVHEVRIWSKPPQPNLPVQLLHFQVRVYPHGGAVGDATNADANWVAAVNNLTFEQATSRPFRDNHTIEPIDPDKRELALLKIAVERQKASTLIELTPQAKADIITEMRTMLLAGQCTTKASFTTAQRYPILDIDPHADTFKSFDARITFALFHNATNELWQMSHLEATSGIINNVDVANASTGGKSALHNAGQHVTFVAPAPGGAPPSIARSTALAANVTTTMCRATALKSMSIRIDCIQDGHQETGLWKSARKQSAGGVLPEVWEYAWEVPQKAVAGRHSIWAEGRTAPSSKRTKAVSRTITLT
jgi:hypothetical protein